jgi:hypothetical protein
LRITFTIIRTHWSWAVSQLRRKGNEHAKAGFKFRSRRGDEAEGLEFSGKSASLRRRLRTKSIFETPSTVFLSPGCTLCGQLLSARLQSGKAAEGSYTAHIRPDADFRTVSNWMGVNKHGSRDTAGKNARLSVGERAGHAPGKK